jgi:hypothetical protein
MLACKTRMSMYTTVSFILPLTTHAAEHVIAHFTWQTERVDSSSKLCFYGSVSEHILLGVPWWHHPMTFKDDQVVTRGQLMAPKWFICSTPCTKYRVKEQAMVETDNEKLTSLFWNIQCCIRARVCGVWCDAGEDCEGVCRRGIDAVWFGSYVPE